MSTMYLEWEILQRLRDDIDAASIGCTFPREPMPIEMLLAEMDRHMPEYRPMMSSFLPPFPNRTKDTP